MAYLNANITLMNLAFANLQPRLGNQLISFWSFWQIQNKIMFSSQVENSRSCWIVIEKQALAVN